MRARTNPSYQSRASCANRAGPGAARPPVNQALDSIMEMAVQLPALRKLGEDLGMSLDAGLAGVARPLAEDAPGQAGESPQPGETAG